MENRKIRKYWIGLAVLVPLLGTSCGRPLAEVAEPSDQKDAANDQVQTSDENPAEEAIPSPEENKISDPIDWSQASIKTNLIRPKEFGNRWSRRLILEGPTDLGEWIVEKTITNELGETQWKPVGVTDSNGIFIDYYIDQAGQYRIGQKLLSEKLSPVRDLVVSDSDLCKDHQGQIRKLSSFRVVLKLGNPTESFTLKGCSLDIEAVETELLNSIHRNTPANRIENLALFFKQMSSFEPSFDLRIISNTINLAENVYLDFRGKKGADGLPVVDGAKGAESPNIFLERQGEYEVIASWMEKKEPQKKEGGVPDKSANPFRGLFPRKSSGSWDLNPKLGIMSPSEKLTVMRPKEFLESTNHETKMRILPLDSDTYTQWVSLLKGQDGESGPDGNDGENGEDGGKIFFYSVKKVNLKVNVYGGVGGLPSKGGNGGDGGDGVRVYLHDPGSKYSTLFSVSKKGDRGKNGKTGQEGQSGRDGMYLWVPVQNPSQFTGFYDEKVE